MKHKNTSATRDKKEKTDRVSYLVGEMKTMSGVDSEMVRQSDGYTKYLRQTSPLGYAQVTVIKLQIPFCKSENLELLHFLRNENIVVAVELKVAFEAEHG